ncbi:hypothetical protein [Halorussus sp. MSC15.2]|uniref:hypothetical protein n=1 Tax=Halorussus sp. MSC15.2 TaxID=2283638 RepID=UPI0013D752FB|nr:hypothetical protein [Halorussus sp. MSC15.2]NEU59193.1 hypothetical protein [Halorussus sp. MSC15.2]
MAEGPDERQYLTLQKECESAEKRLDNQSDTIEELGNNATKMFRVLLVSSAAIIAGLFQFRGPNMSLREAIQPHSCILSIVAGGFFLSIFFLVSATLGVGTAIKHTSGEIEEIHTAKRATPHVYFIRKLDILYQKISYNEGVIKGQRRIMVMADAFVSISFVALVLFGAKLYIGSLSQYIVYLVILVISGCGAYIDVKYPPGHPAKILPSTNADWGYRLRSPTTIPAQLKQSCHKLAGKPIVDILKAIIDILKPLLVISIIILIASQLPNCQSPTDLIPMENTLRRILQFIPYILCIGSISYCFSLMKKCIGPGPADLNVGNTDSRSLASVRPAPPTRTAPTTGDTAVASTSTSESPHGARTRRATRPPRPRRPPEQCRVESAGE